MPTIRYHLRNEYGLGNSDLYRTADKDDPEAVLESVGMAGLVGLLRQLGDLAELAADIFQNLHEEIISTSSRGHGVMLRVQQLETELPLREKSILAEPTYSHFSCSEGVEWHGDQQIGQNLVTMVEMPNFVMNSYRECRGPPKLFMLDKFDVSGDGACLKRYTDPSIYRTTSLATLVEEEARLERQDCKLKMKSHLVETETPQRSTSEDDSRFGPISDHDPAEAQSKNGKLKSRKLNENGSCIRNYMEQLLEIRSLEDKLLSESESSRRNHMRSTESLISVCDIAIDASSNTVRSRKPSFANDEMTLPPIYEVKKQTTEKNDYKTSPVKPAVQLSEISAKSSKIDQRELFSDDRNKIDVHMDHSLPSENLLDASLCLDVEHSGFSTDADTVTGESFDGYLSDELASEMDNYTDALTTMDSETEMDQRSKLDLRPHCGEPQEMDADLNGEQRDHESRLCQQHSPANSSESPGFSTLFRKGVVNPSFSDTLGNLAAQLLTEKSTSSTPSPTSNIQQNKSSADVKASDISTCRSRSVEIHSTSSLSRFHSQASYYRRPSLITAKDQEGTVSYDSETIENYSDAKPSDSANLLAFVSQSEETYPPTDSDFEEIKEQESKQINPATAYRVKPSPAAKSSDGKCPVDHLDDLAEFLENKNCSDSEDATQYPCISLKEERVLSTQYHAVSAELCEEISDLVIDKRVDSISCEKFVNLPDSSLNQSGSYLSAENEISSISKRTQDISVHAIVASDEPPVEVDKVVSESETVVQSFTISNNTQSSQVVHSSNVGSLDKKTPESQIPFSTESALEGEFNQSPSRLNTGLPPLPPPRKPPSARNGARDALIESVASHDKRQLRKAPELFRSSAMPKLDERGAYLEQIRNKSFSLKPTALAAPSLKFKGGPPTNLKVIAILEKANAIRQACAGSDDDDDDSWSDS